MFSRPVRNKYRRECRKQQTRAVLQFGRLDFNNNAVSSSSAGRDDSPLADTFPDPAGRHSPGLAVRFGLRQRVRGRGGVVVRHQVSVVRHEVAPQLVKVLHGGRQEELHPAEDVQQRLQEEQTVSREGAAQAGRPAAAVNCGAGVKR